MPDVTPHLAAELRARFDATFAEPAGSIGAGGEHILDIRLSGHAYALRTGELAALWADKVVTPLPSTAPGLLGLTAMRGQLVPVFDLAELMGHAPTRSPRWIAVLSEPTVGFAFETLARHVRTPAEALSATGTSEDPSFVRGFVRLGDEATPIIRLPSIVRAVRARVAQEP